MKTLLLFLLVFPVLIISSCNERRTETQVNSNEKCLPVDRVRDLAGFFDPVLQVLFTTEEDKDAILKKLGPEKLNDSEYVMPWKTISGKSMNINFQVVPAVQGLIFLYVEQAEKNAADYLAGNDTSRAEFIQSFVDNNGTYARLYRQARCDTVTKDTTFSCTEKVLYQITLQPSLGFDYPYWGLDSVKYKPSSQITTIRTGKYATIQQRTVKNCLKGGNDYCVEELVITQTENIYADKNCRQLLETKNTYRYSCR